MDSPIWADTTLPGSNEVALFREPFTLSETLASAKLAIFADTRYEAWLDGAWVGNGPARFSRATHEYDLYNFGTLAPGPHIIAVLVQWAPNVRRSESTSPYLQAHIQGERGSQFFVIARTSPAWKSMRSDAWEENAAPVHSWGLIGPTELLDLSRLPANWMRPEYPDLDWPGAQVKDLSEQVVNSAQIAPLLDLSTHQLPDFKPELILSEAQFSPAKITYRPRSIPFLERVPIQAKAIDAGLLSPGRNLAELVPPLPNPYSLSFTALQNTSFNIETLYTPDTPISSSIRLDGQVLNWMPAGHLRPDVYQASSPVLSGAHQLTFTEIPTQGLTFSISNTAQISASLPFAQGLNAGRRLLLSKPESRPDLVQISGSQNLDVEFDDLPAYILLDLGRVIQGRVEAQVSGAAGAIIDMGWDERLLGGKRALPYPGSLHPQWDQVNSWILDGTTRSALHHRHACRALYPHRRMGQRSCEAGPLAGL